MRFTECPKYFLLLMFNVRVMERRYPDTKRKDSQSHAHLSSTNNPKVLNVLFVRALADRLRNSPVIVNAVDPGYAISEFRSRGNFHGLMLLVFYMMDLLLALSTEKGSRRLVWGALGGKEDEERLRGAFLRCSLVSEPSDFVISDQGQEVQERIWVRVH